MQTQTNNLTLLQSRRGFIWAIQLGARGPPSLGLLQLNSLRKFLQPLSSFLRQPAEMLFFVTSQGRGSAIKETKKEMSWRPILSVLCCAGTRVDG